MYDEQCKTVYQQSCHYKLVCPKYCKLAGCSDRPSLASQCRKIKHCTRQPQTTCTPHHTKECSIKKYQAPKKVSVVEKLPTLPLIFLKLWSQVKRSVCLPFPNPGPQDEDCLTVQSYLPPAKPLPPLYDVHQSLPDHLSKADSFYPSSQDDLFLPSHSDINIATVLTGDG